MFTIAVRLPAYRAFGLEALDARRRWELPDSSELIFREGSLSRRVTVSEGFARIHFDKQSTYKERTVLVDHLVPDDLMVNDNGYIVWNGVVLTDGRIMELWVAAK